MRNTATSNGGAEAPRIDAPALAHALRETLSLRHPAVAMAFAGTAPAAISAFDGIVPSACTLWRLAEERVFFAPAEAHVNCPVGAMTMGFSMSDELQARLMDTIGTMASAGYFDPVEAASVPQVPGDKNGIVYGPLEQFPVTPDVVLVWVSGENAMLLSEAANRVQWAPQDSGQPALGRPSCAAIALAVQRGAPALSLGCAGMRAFTEIEPDQNLAIVPRAALGDLRERLEAVAQANARMGEHYLERKLRFSAAAV